MPTTQTLLEQLSANSKRLRAVPVNPKTFGAKGDGVADDTAAVQAALNSAGPSGCVFLLLGDYRITQPLVMPDGCGLAGSPNSRLIVTADFTPVFSSNLNDLTYVVRPGVNCFLEDLHIECNQHNVGGILLYNAHRTSVSGCQVYGWKGNHFGIGSLTSNNCYILNNTLKFGDHAIHAYKSDFTTVVGNQIDCVFSGVYTGWSRHCLIANNIGTNAGDVLFDLEGGEHCVVTGNYAERAKNGEYTIYSGGNEDTYVSNHLIFTANTAHRKATYVTSYNSDGSENVADCEFFKGACTIASLDEGCYASGFENNTLTIDFGFAFYHAQMTDKNNREVYFRKNNVTSTTGLFWRCLNSDGLSIIGNDFLGKAYNPLFEIETGQNETRDMHNGRITGNRFVYQVKKTGGYAILLNTSDGYATKAPIVSNNTMENTGDFGLQIDLFQNNGLAPTIKQNELTSEYTANGGLSITANGDVRLVGQRLKIRLNDGSNDMTHTGMWHMGPGYSFGSLAYGRSGYNGSTAVLQHAHGSGLFLTTGIEVGGLEIKVSGNKAGIDLNNGTGAETHGFLDVVCNSY